MKRYGVTLILLSISLVWSIPPARAEYATAQLIDAQGATVGEADLTQTQHGLLIKLYVFDLPPGIHGFHIHEVGKCEPPTASAGGHFNPSHTQHGLLSEEGPHAGDLPNIHMPEKSSLTLEILAPQVSLTQGQNPLLDDDGSALVIHAGADDYRTQPAGDAGLPIVCGIIRGPFEKGLASILQAVTLMQQMKDVFEPADPTIRKVRITVQTADEQVEWVAGQAVKTLPEGKALLTVMLEPKSLRGNTILVQERTDQSSTKWVYNPALRRVREIVPVDTYERFLGTDFTYADLGLVRVHEHYHMLGVEEYHGQRAYKIEEKIPEEQAYYSRIITWVAADSKLPLRREYYSVAGELWKTEKFTDVTTIDGVRSPLRITMQDVKDKTSTELRFEQVEYNAEVPDTLFDPKQLTQAVEAPMWQSYQSAATTVE